MLTIVNTPVVLSYQAHQASNALTSQLGYQSSNSFASTSSNVVMRRNQLSKTDSTANGTVVNQPYKVGYSEALQLSGAYKNLTSVPPENLTYCCSENVQYNGTPTVGVAPLQMANATYNSTTGSLTYNSDPPELTLGSGWGGLDANNPTCQCTGSGISDVDVASGAGYVVETVNLHDVRVWTTSGTLVATYDADTVFGLPTCCDTHVYFDQLNGRWILTGTADNNNHYYMALAVSKTNSPTSTSNFLSYNITSVWENNYLFDNPITGYSSDKLAIDASTSGGDELFVFNESQLLTGSAVYEDYAPSPSWFDNAPVQAISSGNTLYMACNSCGGTSTQLYVFKITGSIGQLTMVRYTVSIKAMHTTQEAPVNGGNNITRSVASNPREPQYLSSDIWVDFVDGCTPSGDSATRDCIRIIQISTSSMTAVQDFDDGVSGQYFYDPAITLDTYGDLFVVYAFSNANNYVETVYAAQSSYDSPNALGYAEYLSFYPTGYSGSIGDYFGISPDPTNPELVWAASQWQYVSGGSNYWSTHIQSFAVYSARVVTKATNGSEITGYYVGLYNSGGTLIDHAFSPATFYGLSVGTQYSVKPDDYGYCSFGYWANGATLRDHTFTASGHDGVTAYYNCFTSPSVMIQTVDSSGNKITGYNIVLENSNGVKITSGFSWATFSVTPGTTYKVDAQSYNGCNFDHWQDTGSTTNPRTFNATDSLTFTAVYSGTC